MGKKTVLVVNDEDMVSASITEQTNPCSRLPTKTLARLSLFCSLPSVCLSFMCILLSSILCVFFVVFFFFGGGGGDGEGLRCFLFVACDWNGYKYHISMRTTVAVLLES